jgi:hypothetical protein
LCVKRSLDRISGGLVFRSLDRVDGEEVLRALQPIYLALYSVGRPKRTSLDTMSGVSIGSAKKRR